MVDSSSLTSQIPSNLHFPTEEEKVKTFWDDKDAFHTCLKQSKGNIVQTSTDTFGGSVALL